MKNPRRISPHQNRDGRNSARKCMFKDPAFVNGKPNHIGPGSTKPLIELTDQQGVWQRAPRPTLQGGQS